MKNGKNFTQTSEQVVTHSHGSREHSHSAGEVDSVSGTHSCGCEYHAHGDTHAHSHVGHEHSGAHNHAHACSCGHCHGEESNAPKWLLWVRLGSSAALGAVAALFLDGWAQAALFVAAWAISAYDLVINMCRNIAHGEIFDENLLMVVASAGALAVGEGLEGLAVILLYQLGEFLQDKAVERSQASISSMLDLRPDTANLLRPNGLTTVVRAEEVAVGDRVLVRAGERVPVDGVVTSGRAGLDTSAMTGESLPRAVAEGDEVLSGFISTDGAIIVEATAAASESAAANLEHLLAEAEANKAPTEDFITRFAKIYTPAVMGAAALVLLVGGLATGEWGDWIHRALTFLVVSCPCALVISVPLGFFSGMGGAARRGIMLKGGAALETLGRKGLSVAFDKTGTLTEGRFAVSSLRTNGVDNRALLAVAAAAESRSSHPLASAIVSAASNCESLTSVELHNLARGGCLLDGEIAVGERSLDGGIAVESLRELAGLGLEASSNIGTIYVGNAALMARAGVKDELFADDGTTVHVALGERYLGAIALRDEPKAGAAVAVETLKTLGVARVVMLTGDADEPARAAARELGISEYCSGLLPQDKLKVLENMQKLTPVVFVGDGINDAPVLAAADVGVAMANGKNRVSVEAADAVIMSGEPQKVATALEIGRKTRKIVRENVAGSLAVKAAVLVLAALGWAPMWLAVVADVGVCLVAVANSLRCMR